MLNRNVALALALAIAASVGVAGCSSEVASQARDACLSAAHQYGGGVGDATTRTTQGWDTENGPVVVEGDWLVSEGEPAVDENGAPAEWKSGYLYPWTCTVDAGNVTAFEFAWGPQTIAAAQGSEPSPEPDAGDQTITDGCLIKGNISYNTGEKIYHVPGQEYYDATIINEAYGERWFCSEQEAIDAGWRKARS